MVGRSGRPGEREASPVIIAAAAYPIDWHRSWNEYVGKLRVWVRTAVEGGAELLVFPDLAAIELASLAGDDNARDPARAVEALTARIKDVDALHASLSREFDAFICAAAGPIRLPNGRIVNRARFFAPDGGRGAQDKLAPTPDEREIWGVEPGDAPRVFETRLGGVGVLIGADLADPTVAGAMARAGAAFLLAPARAASAEDAAALRAAAEARMRETGCVVALAVVVDDADWLPAVRRSTGAAVVLGPAGDGPADGVLAVGKADAPGWVHAEIDLAAYAARRSPPPAAAGDPVAEVTTLVSPPQA